MPWVLGGSLWLPGAAPRAKDSETKMQPIHSPKCPQPWAASQDDCD
ncbi:hypothetical protein PspLS_09471 [Pyricularia sp. CBS 133598]|nr:hypothetical protein PspLS_09471 [Pyricularia sp. CBS 133598]